MANMQHTAPMVPYANQGIPSPAPTPGPYWFIGKRNPFIYTPDGVQAALDPRIPISSLGTINSQFQSLPSAAQPTPRPNVSKRKRVNPQVGAMPPPAQPGPALPVPKRRRISPQIESVAPATQPGPALPVPKISPQIETVARAAPPAPRPPVSEPIPVDPRLLATSPAAPDRKARISNARLLEGLQAFGVDAKRLRPSDLAHLKNLPSKQSRHDLCLKWKAVTVVIPALLRTNGIDSSELTFETLEDFYNKGVLYVDPRPGNPSSNGTDLAVRWSPLKAVGLANELEAQRFAAELEPAP